MQNRSLCLLLLISLIVNVYGAFSEWSEWGACPRVCGISQKIRTRTCTRGGFCTGNLQEATHCCNDICMESSIQNDISNPSSSYSCHFDRKVTAQCQFDEGNTCIGESGFKGHHCICSAEGFEVTGTKCNDSCQAVKCEDLTGPNLYKLHQHCGRHALSCTGTLPTRLCNCDTHSYLSSDGRFCYEATCQSTQEYRTRCGVENKCVGTQDSFVCECDGAGYTTNVTDNSCVLMTCESGDLDPQSTCGFGATACTGNVLNLNCTCGDGYVQAEDGQLCVAAPCTTNTTMQNNCGEENTCEGGLVDWKCICNTRGYTTDPTDVQTCKKIMCEDNGFDSKTVCGPGSTSCVGHIVNPRCICDTTQNYVANINGTRCIKASCNADPSSRNKCGAANSCFGTYGDFICICSAPGYKLDEGTGECVQKECSEAGIATFLCGVGASGCIGNQSNPLCVCKADEGYYPDSDGKTCVLAPCKSNPLYASQCGKENSCYGNKESFKCICDAPGFKEDPTNMKKCVLKTCESGDLDLDFACGRGALSCKGTMKNVDCKCDNANGYVRAPEGNRCLKNDCYANVTSRELCGTPNGCVGSIDDWMCNCNAYGYKPNTLDRMKCDKVMCGDPGVDHFTICGGGSTNCSGHITNPTCVCNTTSNFVTSSDGFLQCVSVDCKTNPKAINDCGVENSCSGTYDNYVCICDAYGYRLDGINQACVKIKCDDPDVDYEKVCGVGGIGCNGTMESPSCICNASESFITTSDRRSCLKASCRGSEEAKSQCGEANTCFGNADSFVCSCTGVGYKRDEMNLQSCSLETCEANELDHTIHCGKGSLGCTGNILNLTCICDNENGYVQSADGRKCVANDCKGNATTYEQCGDGNSCMGSLSEWFCVCIVPGYAPDENDPMKCAKKMCSNSIAVDVCGPGATGCSGPIMRPKCECDKTMFYTPSRDGRQCLKESCEQNYASILQCGSSNKCVGSADDFFCVCDGYGYKSNGTRDQLCIEKTCNDADADFVDICGTGGIGCTGTVLNPFCKCNETEYYVPNRRSNHCVLASCRVNETILELCGRGNTCVGSLESHICQCDKPGYKYHDTNSQICLQETCEDGDLNPLRVCGKGAISCQGTLLNLTCECNNDMGYVQSPDATSCIAADCRSNASVPKQCGELNRCQGSLTNWVCLCDAPGYVADKSDFQKCHQKTCADPGVDPEKICGIGATGCTGPVATPICECNTSAYYVPSADRYSCIPASCKSNKTAIKQCGEMNSCTGTSDNFICVCDGFGYELDAKDNQKCIKKTCSDADADYIEICGQGGTKCQGSVGNHQCECDTKKYFVPSPNRKSCVFSNCRGNDTALRACGKGNMCFGSTSSFICVCDAPGYKTNPSNLQECMKQTCEAGELNHMQVCGKGATGCKGTLDDLKCMCDNNLGYAVSPDQTSCIPADCHANSTMVEECGQPNQCIGSLTDWRCVCNAPGYYADANNSRRCRKEMCSENDIDAEKICGTGAISCVGPVVSPICFCDVKKNVVSSTDGSRCIPASCKTNKTAITQCGNGNSCTGSSDNYICVCNSYGYKLDDNNNQACVEKTCSDSDADFIEICGQGGLSCTGTMKKPVCECDHTKNFVPSDDRRSCVLASCRANPVVDAACGNMNTCYGSESSWICLCNAPGSMLNPNNVRECLTGTCENGDIDVQTVCGRGALSCKGSVASLTCECNNHKGYVQSPDRRSCLPSGCRQNTTMQEQCGEVNECIGSLTDWSCICSAPGYRPHDSDQMKCHRRMCYDANVNPVEVCGVGAIGCNGSVVTPQCTCNTSAYYVPSLDGSMCIPAPCHSNKDALKKCGVGNSCFGTTNNYVCVCDSFGYRLDDTDPHKCVEIQCDDDGVDIEKICGQGSTICDGTARKPFCQCDHASHFVPSLDSSSCLLASCRANGTVTDMCKDGNTCFGSMTSHICVCQANGYKSNPLNTQECLEETCEANEINALAACGKGATSCAGTLKNLECNCGDGYVQSSDKTSCLPVHCRHNNAVEKTCGDSNACVGSYNEWYCDCTAAGLVPHPTNKSICLLKMCSTDPVASCGLGATECHGDLYEHVCTCDFDAGYILSKDHHSCVPGDCKMNPNMNCGFGNTCQGTFFSYVCICSASGTMRNPSIATECININCPSDAVSVCGEGASGCEITSENDVNCTCGQGYHPGYELNSCLVDDCKYNPEAAAVCGVENECVGSYLSWMCVCKGPQYKQDPTNTQSCVPGPCRIERCGSGEASGSFQYYADSCNGTYFDYDCQCRDQFERDELGGCVAKSCKHNPRAVAECGVGMCHGTYFKYTCRCNGPAFMQNPANKTECIEAPCQRKHCGTGLINDYYVEFASSCQGTYNNHTCICKNGFHGTGTPICYSELEACGKYGKCHENASCVNYGGGYKCECEKGYSGDGKDCYLDGGLSPWSVTQDCDSTCGSNGFAKITRACDNPTPDLNGKGCGEPSPNPQTVPCNRFLCTGCNVQKTCGCSAMTPYFLDDYSEPDVSLKYFSDVDSKAVEKSVSMLSHWGNYMKKKPICMGNNANIISQNVTQIQKNLQELNDFQAPLVNAKDLMRKKIDCNINLPRKVQYFDVYIAIIKRHFAIRQVIKDLKIKESLLMKQQKECEDSKVGWLRKVIGM